MYSLIRLLLKAGAVCTDLSIPIFRILTVLFGISDNRTFQSAHIVTQTGQDFYFPIFIDFLENLQNNSDKTALEAHADLKFAFSYARMYCLSHEILTSFMHGQVPIFVKS